MTNIMTILASVLAEAAPRGHIRPPSEVDAFCTPALAYELGFLDALQKVIDACKEEAHEHHH